LNVLANVGGTNYNDCERYSCFNEKHHQQSRSADALSVNRRHCTTRATLYDYSDIAKVIGKIYVYARLFINEKST
jgi:hypothetical protein